MTAAKLSRVRFAIDSQPCVNAGVNLAEPLCGLLPGALVAFRDRHGCKVICINSSGWPQMVLDFVKPLDDCGKPDKENAGYHSGYRCAHVHRGPAIGSRRLSHYPNYHRQASGGYGEPSDDGKSNRDSRVRESFSGIRLHRVSFSLRQKFGNLPRGGS